MSRLEKKKASKITTKTHNKHRLEPSKNYVHLTGESASYREPIFPKTDETKSANSL